MTQCLDVTNSIYFGIRSYVPCDISSETMFVAYVTIALISIIGVILLVPRILKRRKEYSNDKITGTSMENKP